MGAHKQYHCLCMHLPHDSESNFFSSFFLFSRKFSIAVDSVPGDVFLACYCHGTLSPTNPRETFVKRLECKSAQMQRGEVFAVF